MNSFCILIEEDLHNERVGYFRAFTADHPAARIMCPLIGYCSTGGSHRTIRAAAAEANRLQPDAHVYRRGKLLYPKYGT